MIAPRACARRSAPLPPYRSASLATVALFSVCLLLGSLRLRDLPATRAEREALLATRQSSQSTVDAADFWPPRLPATGVLRPLARVLESTMEPADLLVADASLRGACVQAVLAQPRAPPGDSAVAAHRFDHSQLRLTAAVRGRALPLRATRVLSTPVRHTQGSAFVEACAPELAGLQHVEVGFHFPGLQPALVRVERLPAPRAGSDPAELALCTMIKGTAHAHLAAWVEYHVRLGAGHVFVFVNEPWAEFVARPGLGALDGLRRSGVLSLTAWALPRWYPGDAGSHLAQTTAANACHRHAALLARRFAFLDVDEWLYAPAGLRAALPRVAPPGEEGCVLLANAWGALTSPLPPRLALDDILAADVWTLGPLVDLPGADPHAQYRHKLLAAGRGLELVGIHGSVPVAAAKTGWAVSSAPPPCVFNWTQTRATSLATDPRTIGYLHILSESLKSARPSSENSANGRSTAAIVAAITAPGSGATRSWLLRQSLDASGRAPLAALLPPALVSPLVRLAPLDSGAAASGGGGGGAPPEEPAPPLGGFTPPPGDPARPALLLCALSARLEAPPAGVVSALARAGIGHIVMYLVDPQWDALPRGDALRLQNAAWGAPARPAPALTLVDWGGSGGADGARSDCIARFGGSAGLHAELVLVAPGRRLGAWLPEAALNHSVASAARAAVAVAGEDALDMLPDAWQRPRPTRCVALQQQRQLPLRGRASDSDVDDASDAALPPLLLRTGPQPPDCARPEPAAQGAQASSGSNDAQALLQWVRPDGAAATAAQDRWRALPLSHCPLCVADTPPTAAALAVAASAAAVEATQTTTEIFAGATERTFVREAAAFARCELAPACAPVQPRAHVALVGPGDPRAAEDAGGLLRQPSPSASGGDALQEGWELQGDLAPPSAAGAPSSHPVAPPTPLAMPADLPPGSRLLVQGKNTRGRYSNMRYALLDMVSLGMATNRTVLLAPLEHSPGQCAEPLEVLFDWRALNALHRVLAPPPGGSGVPRQRLAAYCGAGAAAGGLHAAHRPTMLLNTARQRAWIPHSTTLMPTWGQWKVAGGVEWAVEPFGSNAGEARGANAMRARMLARVDELQNATCLGLSTAYWIFPAFHARRIELADALRPGRAIAHTIATFLSAPPLSGSDRFVGLHLRQGDIGFTNATHCACNVSALAGAARDLQAAHGLRTVVLATDEPAGRCAQELAALLPPGAVLPLASGVYAADSCAEAQFVQEVLARAFCFVGSVNSSFSAAVTYIRGAARARGTAAWPPPCTQLLDPGSVHTLW